MHYQQKVVKLHDHEWFPIRKYPNIQDYGFGHDCPAPWRTVAKETGGGEQKGPDVDQHGEPEDPIPVGVPLTGIWDVRNGPCYPV